MPTSVEILVPGARDLKIRTRGYPFKVVTSSPPKSHRSPRSLWQNKFYKLGGTLIHVGDPLMPKNGYFWAYEIFSHTETSPGRVRFKPKIYQKFRALLGTLLEYSPTGNLIIGFDDQFGPMPKVYKREFDLHSFSEMNANSGLRLNSLLTLRK